MNSGHSRFHRSRSVGCGEIETVTASRPNQEAEADGTALALLSPTITGRVIEKFARIAHPTPPKEFEELSERERDVFRLMARGLSNAEIGSELYIGETTVKTHVTHILQKLNLRDRVQAVVLAYQTGLFEPDLRLAE